MGLREGAISLRNKMVTLPSPFCPQLSGGPSLLPHPQRDLTLGPHPVSHTPGGRVGVEEQVQGLLETDFSLNPPPFPPCLLSRSQKTLLGKWLRVAALPPPVITNPNYQLPGALEAATPSQFL